jgi:hypothetical protein
LLADAPLIVRFFFAITTFDPGLASPASFESCTLKFVLVYVAGTGFVTPAIATVPAAPFASVHPDGSVTVTTLLEVEPVAPAPQPLKLPPKVIAGDAGRPDEKPLSKVIVRRSPGASEPVAEAVKPTVYVVDAAYVEEPELNETAVTGVAAPIVTFDAGLASDASPSVWILKFVLA